MEKVQASLEIREQPQQNQRGRRGSSGKGGAQRNLESGAVQLFDLEKDLSEAHDLSAALPDKARELERLLDDRLKRANAQMPTVNPDYDPDASVTRGRRERRGR